VTSALGTGIGVGRSERLLTPHPCLIPSLSIRNGQGKRERVKEVERNVTHVSRLHIAKEAMVMMGATTVRVYADVNIVKAEGLDEIGGRLLEELWGTETGGWISRW